MAFNMESDRIIFHKSMENIKILQDCGLQHLKPNVYVCVSKWAQLCRIFPLLGIFVSRVDSKDGE